MALFVTASNFLVQYPINFFGMEEFLTYGAFTYPVTFLVTDLSNRRYGKFVARKIVYMGFFLGVLLTFGIIIFSGSLYLLVLTDIRLFGALTPIGGVSFIAGWIILIMKIRAA